MSRPSEEQRTKEIVNRGRERLIKIRELLEAAEQDQVNRLLEEEPERFACMRDLIDLDPGSSLRWRLRKEADNIKDTVRRMKPARQRSLW